MSYELLDRRAKDEIHPFTEERRRPRNPANEANRISVAGGCTCGECDEPSDFARAAMIFEAATLLDELTADIFAPVTSRLQSLNLDQAAVKMLVEKLHDLAEELAGSRVGELYGNEVERGTE